MASGTRLRYDGIETYLANPITEGATDIQFATELMADGGILIDSITPGSDTYLAMSILDSSYRLQEIVHLTAYQRNTKVGTIERHQEGTTAKPHATGVKVVHAPTSDDFFDVQMHLADPLAHQGFIHQTVDAAITDAMITHKAEADPHPVYLLRTNATFPSGAVIPSGQTLVIQSGATLLVENGASLIVRGDLIIDSANGGRIFINGHQLIISKTKPTNPPADVVWIQTFG
jgi:hypothetical protein